MHQNYIRLKWGPLSQYSGWTRARRLSFDFRQGEGNFCVGDRVRSGAYPASYQIGTRWYFPGGKASGEWRRPLTSILAPRLRTSGVIPPFPHTSLLMCYLKHS